MLWDRVHLHCCSHDGLGFCLTAEAFRLRELTPESWTKLLTHYLVSKLHRAEAVERHADSLVVVVMDVLVEPGL